MESVRDVWFVGWIGELNEGGIPGLPVGWEA